MMENEDTETRHEIRVAGLRISTLRKSALLQEIERRLDQSIRTVIFTPYSEFLRAGLKDSSVMRLLNQADLLIPDGIGVMWAAAYLRIPLHFQSRFLRTLDAMWQVVYTGAAILLWPAFIRSVVPEKIVGADIVWDVAQVAAKKGKSIYLLGGYGQTPFRTAEKLREKFPGLRVDASNQNPENTEQILADLQRVRPDILFVAFGPIRQERWITEHLDHTSVRLALGVGGTFDYIAGQRRRPPAWIRQSGLEWLFRLFTQPKRFKRIYQATIGLIVEMVRYKVKGERKGVN